MEPACPDLVLDSANELVRRDASSPQGIGGTLTKAFSVIGSESPEVAESPSASELCDCRILVLGHLEGSAHIVKSRVSEKPHWRHVPIFSKSGTKGPNACARSGGNVRQPKLLVRVRGHVLDCESYESRWKLSLIPLRLLEGIGVVVLLRFQDHSEKEFFYP